MAKASITLPNGTHINVDGSAEEVAHVMSLYGGAGANTPANSAGTTRTTQKRARRTRRAPSAPSGTSGAWAAATSALGPADIASIVNMAKTCDEAEAIESQILDKNSVIDRTLLPLYVVHDYLENKFALTSGDINRITTQMGVPVATPHASTTLSGSGSRYVIGDGVRRRGGAPVRYKLSRRGQQYMKSVVTGRGVEAGNLNEDAQ